MKCIVQTSTTGSGYESHYLFFDNVAGEATCPDHSAPLCPQSATEEQERCDDTHRERQSEHKVRLHWFQILHFVSWDLMPWHLTVCVLWLYCNGRRSNFGVAWYIFFIHLSYSFTLGLKTNVFLSFPSPEQHQQPGQKHHPHHHACWHEADRRKQTSQFCHSSTVPAASAARTGHTGYSSDIFPYFTACLRIICSLSQLRWIQRIVWHYFFSFLQVRIQTVPAQQVQQHIATGSPKSVSTVVVTTAPSKCAPDTPPALQQWSRPISLQWLISQGCYRCQNMKPPKYLSELFDF